MSFLVKVTVNSQVVTHQEDQVTYVMTFTMCSNLVHVVAVKMLHYMNSLFHKVDCLD